MHEVIAFIGVHRSWWIQISKREVHVRQKTLGIPKSTGKETFYLSSDAKKQHERNNNNNDNDKTKREKPNTYYNPQLYIPKGVFQSHFEHSKVKFKKDSQAVIGVVVIVVNHSSEPRIPECAVQPEVRRFQGPKSRVPDPRSNYQGPKPKQKNKENPNPI